MSLIRELAQKERHRIWMEEYAPRLKKGLPVGYINKKYKTIIEDDRNPFLRQGLCNLILDQCNEVEDLLKVSLEGKNIFCPECDQERWIVRSEPPRNYDFIPLPRWRLLSCGHMIGITGKVLTEKEKNKIFKELNELMTFFRSKVE
jgi:hypothetical protein